MVSSSRRFLQLLGQEHRSGLGGLEMSQHSPEIHIRKHDLTSHGILKFGQLQEGKSASSTLHCQVRHRIESASGLASKCVQMKGLSD